MAGKETGGLKLIYRFVRETWPEVDSRLEGYARHAGRAKDGALAQQALASLKAKRFHALGGSIYALYPGTDKTAAINFIVALQTISDYLDNLCDRAGIIDESAFRQLHLAMTDAVDTSSELADYYLYYPHKNDSGYLKALVEECRASLKRIPSYHLVKDRIKHLAVLYSNLQIYKHLDPETREDRLAAWAAENGKDCPDLRWWEFSAATGSTLGIFALLSAANDPELKEIETGQIHTAYFPWIAGLHILLDYFIDSGEDRDEGDLNFTGYYNSVDHCRQRLAMFIQRSRECCLKLEHPDFHMSVVKGLLAMYLSDPKAFSGSNAPISRALVRAGGLKTCLYHRVCMLLRKQGKL